MRVILSFLVAFGIVGSTPATASTTRTVQQWDDSIDHLVDQLRATHPEPFAKIGRLEFLRAAENLKKDLPRLTEEQRMVQAMRLVASIGDGHTQLEPDRPDFGKWYPIHVVEFPDGYFVTSAFKGHQRLAGAEVLKIAGRPVGDAAAAARSLVGMDNDFGKRWHLGSLHNAALMRGLGFAAADWSLNVSFRLANGKIVTQSLPAIAADDPRYSANFSRNDWEDGAETLGPPLGSPSDWTTAFRGEPASAFRVRDDRHPVHLTLRRALVTRNLPEANAYYIQSNIVEDSFDESFRHLFNRAMAEIDAAKSKNIILDLRNNPGGDGSRIPELVTLFGRHLSRQQNLYLLTGPKTFSAAILWLGDFITFLHPTIVGEPAGAALNSFGDAHEFPLVQIGATSHISTLRNVKSGVLDLSRFTPVDIPAPMTFADWRAGRDPAVDPILAGQEMRSFAQIALTDGADAARTAMLERETVFRKHSWWTPPPEIELRRAVQLLTEEGRYEDAIAIGEINTKFHPDIWNSWYNLGQAQLQAGRLVEGQENLRKVLEVDPDNFNKNELADIFARDPAKRFTVPPILQWGSAPVTIEAVAKRDCATSRTRRIDPPFLASVKREQVQIDCDGFDYQGGPRHLELVFRDGQLVMAWLMLNPGDKSSVLEWAKRDLGETAVERGQYTVFPMHLAAWRNDKSELLFYSPALATEAEGWFAEKAS